MSFKVFKKCCNQCLFTENKIVSDERKLDVINECLTNDSHFICHKTDNVCCAGFYARYSTNLMRIAQRLNAVEFVEVADE